MSSGSRPPCRSTSVHCGAAMKCPSGRLPSCQAHIICDCEACVASGKVAKEVNDRRLRISRIDRRYVVFPLEGRSAWTTTITAAVDPAMTQIELTAGARWRHVALREPAAECALNLGHPAGLDFHIGAASTCDLFPGLLG